jgi:hypothetical protein
VTSSRCDRRACSDEMAGCATTLLIMKTNETSVAVRKAAV